MAHAIPKIIQNIAEAIKAHNYGPTSIEEIYLNALEYKDFHIFMYRSNSYNILATNIGKATKFMGVLVYFEGDINPKELQGLHVWHP